MPVNPLKMQPFNTGLMMDDAGNTRQATGGLQDAIWGRQAAGQFDKVQRAEHFDAIRQGGQAALGAAIGGAPKPTGALAGGGWGAFKGLMRSLMLSREAQGKDTRVLGGYGNSQANPARDTSNAFTETAMRYLPVNPHALAALRGKPKGR